MGLRFSRIVLSLFFFRYKRNYSTLLAYRKRAMLKSVVVTGLQVKADVGPEKTVKFCRQTIGAWGFVVAKVFKRVCTFFYVYQSFAGFLFFFAECGYVFWIKERRILEFLTVDIV